MSAGTQKVAILLTLPTARYDDGSRKRARTEGLPANSSCPPPPYRLIFKTTSSMSIWKTFGGVFVTEKSDHQTAASVRNTTTRLSQHALSSNFWTLHSRRELLFCNSPACCIRESCVDTTTCPWRAMLVQHRVGSLWQRVALYDHATSIRSTKPASMHFT